MRNVLLQNKKSNWKFDKPKNKLETKKMGTDEKPKSDVQPQGESETTQNESGSNFAMDIVECNKTTSKSNLLDGFDPILLQQIEPTSSVESNYIVNAHEPHDNGHQSTSGDLIQFSGMDSLPSKKVNVAKCAETMDVVECDITTSKSNLLDEFDPISSKQISSSPSVSNVALLSDITFSNVIDFEFDGRNIEPFHKEPALHRYNYFNRPSLRSHACIISDRLYRNIINALISGTSTAYAANNLDGHSDANQIELDFSEEHFGSICE